MNPNQTGPANVNWKGGRIRGGDRRRYILVKAPPGHPMAHANGYVLEHRLVMANKLGRPLLRSEIVHHMNGDPTDNRLENLELMSQSEHARHHMPETLTPAVARRPGRRYDTRVCGQCEQPFDVYVGDRRNLRKRFCGRECWCAYRSARGGLLNKGEAA